MTTMSDTSITPKVLPPPFGNTSITPSDKSSPLTPRVRPPPLHLTSFTHGSYIQPHYELEEIENSIIQNIDEVIESRLCNYHRSQSIATKSAIDMHNQWRKVYIQQNGDVPRIKKTKDGLEVDINVDGNQLNPEFLEFNYNIALFVSTCINFYPHKPIEEMSSIIHRKWLKMSPWAKGGPLDVPYESLPEIEKEKDRDIYRIVSNYYFN